MAERTPAPEWASQQATLLVWPRAGGDWGDGLAAARDAIAELAAVLCAYQPVILAATDAECRDGIAAHATLAELDRLTVVDVPNDDIWARDTGPITVFDDGERRFLDFRFDGWGGQFAASRDDAFTAAIHATGCLGAGTLERHELTLEGGSIEANGAGALLTTERCLIKGRRNDHIDIDRDHAAALLREALGVKTVHWLTEGDLIGDDTDGHIDTLARFVAADTIVYQGCRDRNDDHYAPLAAMAEELAALRDANGQAYRLVELPLPRPIHDPDDGHRLPAGYANFLIANGCIVMPAFDDPADDAARKIIAELFPDRDIHTVDSRALIRQHGGLHCAAMQIPAEPN
ncbi:agmatine deiminase family protein [Endozoicomonas sp. G2_2]|uniref:agmatine deiminase family protein n=1 Tax=Endozoicomonas sp. G2_2 TaxID=2821092 RepID=UPI001ADD2A7F|nr:agmatine deiminase family protein [Endozoicomonas sp. G2_2]MBO9471549.1 agmatine deiminase family protein [Endozoicomonas sp. G2_2]